MKKKKVIILNHGLHIAGVSRTLVNFANALVRHGYDVTVKIEINDFTLEKELDPRVKRSLFIKEPRPLGLRVKGFLRFYDTFLRYAYKKSAKRQYKFFVRKKYDIEIAFNRGAAARIISGSTNKRAKKLVWVHSDYMRNENPLAGFENLQDAQAGYKKFDHIVCVSKQAETAFAEKFGKDFPLITKYNVMDTERILRFSQKKKIETTAFTIVAVGRLCEAKNYFMLLDAVHELNQRGLSFDLWIVGDGHLRAQLEEQIAQLNVRNVTLLGAKENPYPYLQAADLYVSSSIYEGLSTTTIEALILGKAIVATDCTGMRDILGDSDYGLIVPIETLALADGLERMITDPALREAYANKAAFRAKDFDPEKAFQNIEELF